MLEYVITFILACIVIMWSGRRCVQALSKIARILRWKEFVVASAIMAVGSSLPELFVGITSSIDKEPQLSVGNVLGSNIIALSLLIAIGAFLARGLKFKKKIIQRSSLFAITFTVLPLILMADKELSRLDGIILLIGLGFYVRELFLQQKVHSRPFNHLKLSSSQKVRTFFVELTMFLGSLVLLLLSAEGIVFSATKIAQHSGISLVVIGILGVAVGTSLPEITFEINSIKLGFKEMMLGDAMGSVVINSGLVLGLTALISPFKIHQFGLYLNSFVFSIIIATLFFFFSRSKDEITRKESMLLLFFYILFFLVESLMEMII